MLSLSKLLFFQLFGLVFSSLVMDTQDQCTEWTVWLNKGKNSHIYLQICENATGTSAYYRFKNENPKAVRISFQIEHQNGKTTNGSTRIEAKTQSKDAHCTLCAESRGGGNIQWKLTKITFEGEEGFW